MLLICHEYEYSFFLLVSLAFLIIDIDPRNDSVTGSFLSSSRQEKRLELDPLRPRVVDLNCFSPLSQPSVWSVSTSSVETDAVTSGRWKNTFTETFETVRQ